MGAGAEGPGLAPRRLTPAHGVAAAMGAVFVEAGLWLRAGHFPRPGEDVAAATRREAAMVRAAVGVCDVSTLGKIEVFGPDAGAFLDRVYANTVSTLAEGRVRYGAMLREDGFVLDDGTVARLGERFLVTTTTAAAGEVLSHLEFCAECLWPGLTVAIVPVTEQWAQVAVAGPRAREVVAAAGAGRGGAAVPRLRRGRGRRGAGAGVPHLLLGRARVRAGGAGALRRGAVRAAGRGGARARAAAPTGWRRSRCCGSRRGS